MDEARRHRGTCLATAWVCLGMLAAGYGQQGLLRGAWSREEVGVGVVWKSRHFDELFDRPQNVNVLEVDLAEKGVRVTFARPGGFVRTSRMAADGGAVAAVNGGFYDTRAQAVGLLRIEGKDLAPHRKHRSAALAIGPGGRPFLSVDEEGRWPGIPNVMAAGPLLVRDGGIPPGLSARKARHPRTAVGFTAGGKMLLVTVDGRTVASGGVTLQELARLLVALGARDALNLDGGGSTTMWVRGEPAAGVVNHPCDNKRFDAAGERRVANAVLVHALDIVTADTDEAELLPAGAWRRSREGRGFLGRDWARSTAATALARWRLAVDLPGTYEIQARWPRAGLLTGRAVLSSGSRRRVLDQRTGGARWQPAGRLAIETPDTVVVQLSATSEAAVAADAIRLVQIARN